MITIRDVYSRAKQKKTVGTWPESMQHAEQPVNQLVGDD